MHRHLERHLQTVYSDLFEFIGKNIYNTSKQISLKQAAKLNDVKREARKIILFDLMVGNELLIDWLIDWLEVCAKTTKLCLTIFSKQVIHNLTQPDWVHQRWPQYSNMTTLELVHTHTLDGGFIFIVSVYFFKVLDLKRQERVNDFRHPALAYLRGGFLLGDWLRRAMNVCGMNEYTMFCIKKYIEKPKQVTSGNCPKEAEKAVLYSAHDGTVQVMID